MKKQMNILIVIYDNISLRLFNGIRPNFMFNINNEDCIKNSNDIQFRIQLRLIKII